ncbi:MAG: dirigent protein [Ktedonobacteraceae bacterium]|nr:dirigent protein [Ktedonobacteraceae bacterium]
MKKFFLLVPIVLLLGLAATAIEIRPNTPTASASGVELHFIEHGTAVKEIIVGTTTDVRGNYFVFYDPLFDAADKNQVGNVNGTCLNTSNTVQECHFTLILPKGQITVEGPSTGNAATFAITGGTGIYDQATGQVVQKTITTPTGLEFDLSVDVD